MNNSEIQPIQELAEKRSNLSRVVEQNEKLKTNVDAPLGEGGFTIVPPRRLIKREMSFPEVKEVAKYNLRLTPEKIKEHKQKLRSRIDEDTLKHKSEL